jgi:hypothetical protein
MRVASHRGLERNSPGAGGRRSTPRPTDRAGRPRHRCRRGCLACGRGARSRTTEPGPRVGRARAHAVHLVARGRPPAVVGRR